MKKLLLSAAGAALLATSAFADGPTPVWMEPPVIVPEMPSTWGGAYAGLSYGATTSTTIREETYREEYKKSVKDECKFTADHGPNGIGGNNVPGGKCWFPTNIIGDEFGDLGSCDNYTNTCVMSTRNDGAESRIFVAGDYRKGDVYEYETGETIIEYGEIITQEFVDETTDKNVGAFVGYRHEYSSLVFGVEAGVNGDLKSVEAQTGFNAGQLLPYAFYGVGDFAGEGTDTYGVGADMLIGNNGLFAGAKFTQGDFGEQATVRVGYNF